ncbi:LysE family transporter [Actinospica durhamensis]|uniref:LysE family transporter n=1 Tax=Actinospica durhamensis TaxID=1508375 RepID=A0A941ES85_9ACTN|nr:LysE family transporter [Actinospica durhamensis]MBR7836371.1 LysE family transporter [Actinospica durhamensis]
MLGTVNLPEFTLGALLIVLLPGPNSMYVLSVAARKGVRRGYRAALGVLLGDTVLLTLTAAGAASLMGRSPGLFDVVKYLGAAYLAWLGVGMIRAAVQAVRRLGKTAATADGAPGAEAVAGDGAVLAGTAMATETAETATETATEPTPTTQQQQPNAAERSPLRRALIVSLLNPKAILFDLAFLSQFVSPHAVHPVAAFFLLSMIVQIFSVSYLSALILGGDRLAARFRRRRRLTASLTGGVGSLFLGFAVKLATASLG